MVFKNNEDPVNIIMSSSQTTRCISTQLDGELNGEKKSFPESQIPAVILTENTHASPQCSDLLLLWSFHGATQSDHARAVETLKSF